MASIARIADIRGLVSLNDGEEILKKKTLYLKMVES